MGLYSTEMSKISVVGTWYSNRTTTQKIPFSMLNNTGVDGSSNDELLRIQANHATLTNDKKLESVMIMINHNLPWPWFSWTVASLIHPRE